MSSKKSSSDTIKGLPPISASQILPLPKADGSKSKKKKK